MSSPAYVLGSSPRELSRLSLQAQIIGPITERLLRRLGIKEGLRVLDLVVEPAMSLCLRLRWWGQRGLWLASISPRRQLTRRRPAFAIGAISKSASASARLRSFLRMNCSMIGRYVLIHQPSPSDFLRAARRHVRPGGVIGFHEISCHHELYSLPRAPLFQRMAKLLRIGVSAFPSYDAAGRLLEHFRMADLPHPELFAELPVGGGMDSPLYAWMAETIGSLTPLLVKQGVASAEEIAIDTLEERLRSEVVAMQSQFVCPPQVCAWVRLDGAGEAERSGVTQSNLAYA
jgi:hypothetical protein